MAAACVATSCPPKDDVPYERIILDLEENRPDLHKEVEAAIDVLDFVLCRVPDKDDPKYTKDSDGKEAYEDDMEEMQTKADEIKPSGFPYTFYIMSQDQEKAFDEKIFSSFKGPVYWNDSSRDFIVDPNQPAENFTPENMSKLVYTSLKPLLVWPADQEKDLTPRLLCEAVSGVKFNPREYCFLENIQIQMREIDGKEAMAIIFYAGPEK